jgi:hypothetical protein
MTPQEKQQLNDLLAWKRSMESANTIPLLTDQALRSRLANSTGLTTSAKTAASENQTINEAGAAVVYALNIADAFLQVQVNGTTYYIPVYTS